MAKGPSGRVVIDIEPSVKRRLYSALALEGRTLKDWFLNSADSYLAEIQGADSASKKRSSE